MNNNFDHPAGPIPTKLRNVLKDQLSTIRLHAARAAGGLARASDDRLEPLFAELIDSSPAPSRTSSSGCAARC